MSCINRTKKKKNEAELNKQKSLEQEKQKHAQEKTKGFDGPSFGF